jgi:alpha-D-ribose 1-methylphosphonate 5-triphosphate synthase subunit PhnH
MVERGFLAPGFDSQCIFRTLLTALAEPGRVLPIAPACVPPPPLDATAASVVLALCDGDTPVWLAPHLAPAADFVRFQTGAPITSALQSALFVVADHAHRPPLSALNQGTSEYPDRAATLILTVAALEEGSGWRLSGPGIPDHRLFQAHGIDAGFAAEWQASRTRFPLGVDVIFSARGRLAGLPRSTLLER